MGGRELLLPVVNLLVQRCDSVCVCVCVCTPRTRHSRTCGDRANHEAPTIRPGQVASGLPLALSISQLPSYLILITTLLTVGMTTVWGQGSQNWSHLLKITPEEQDRSRFAPRPMSLPALSRYHDTGIPRFPKVLVSPLPCCERPTSVPVFTN